MLGAMNARASEIGQEIEAVARKIMEDIRVRGDEAVREYSLRFDHAEPREISKEEIEAAYAETPKDLLDAMEAAAENIRRYQSKLLTKTSIWTEGGITLGSIVRGIDRLAIYVPGGSAAYPSSVLMNAVPARVAGVGEILMLTPPTQYLKPSVLAAAKIAGVDRVLALGGIQAVASVTYGTERIPKVEKLVGPGNAYVTAAKRMAYGQIDIDMVAGPSEVLILADDSANPVYVAADLLSQAEHDPLASAILITDSEPLAHAVSKEVERQTGLLSRRAIIERSLEDFGAILICPSLEQGCALANQIAPEHLEILTRDPDRLLPLIRNAGAVFLGAFSPEPLGDYMAGPSHVLPTSGTARFFSPLSVDSFLKKMSLIRYSEEALRAVATPIAAIAGAEELTAHANAIAVRFTDAINKPEREHQTC